MKKTKLNIHKITLDRDSLKYINHYKKEIAYEMMLNEMFIYKIIEDSKNESLKIFEQISSKIYFHYDWKELFKSEINEQIKIIFKLYNKIENKFIIHLPNETNLENKLFPKIDSVSIPHLDFRTFYKFSNINTNSIENFIRTSLLPQCKRFNKKIIMYVVKINETLLSKN